jgi:probable phosphoglycerate mutase
MGEAQMRAVRGVEAIRLARPETTVVAVSHSDIIKAIIAHYLGLNLDFLHRFEIAPASVSTLVVGDWGAKVVRLNEGAAS